MSEPKQNDLNWKVGLIFAVFFCGIILAVGGPPLLAGTAGAVAFAAGTFQ